MAPSDVTDPGITGTVVRGEAVPAAFPAASPRARLRVAVAAGSPVGRAGSHPGHPSPVEGPALSIVTSPLRLYHATRSAAMRALGPVIAGVVLAGALTAPTVAAGRTFYVATNGNDAASGSISHPWRSFHVSLKKLRAGDKLYIRGGSDSFKGVNYSGVAAPSN